MGRITPHQIYSAVHSPDFDVDAIHAASSSSSSPSPSSSSSSASGALPSPLPPSHVEDSPATRLGRQIFSSISVSLSSVKRATTGKHSFSSYKMGDMTFGAFTRTVRPQTTSSKLLIRVFLLCVSLMFVMENITWLISLSLRSAGSRWDWHEVKLLLSVPQVFSNLSAVALFTHFTIHVERQYNANDLLPPSPIISWHPFAEEDNPLSTILLKVHYLFHFSTYLLNIIGCVASGSSHYVHALEPVVMLILAPCVYRFLTLVYTNMWMRHGDLELMKISEAAFAFGCSSMFICLFLAAETLGCLRYDFDEGEDCGSTMYGNWMLGYNSFFMNVLYILLFWLVDTDFSIRNLMKMRISNQYILAFSIQFFASVIFLFFFSQKEFKGVHHVVWAFASTGYLLLWVSSFYILCRNNIPAVAGITDSGISSLFSSTNNAELVEEISGEANESARHMAAQVNSPRGSTSSLNHSNANVLQKGEVDLSQIVVSAKARRDAIKARVVKARMAEPRVGDARVFEAGVGDRDETNKFTVKKLEKISRFGKWTSTIRVKKNLAKICTSKKMYLLRAFLCFVTYMFVALEVSMIVNFSLYKKFVWKSLGMMSFSALCIHFLVVADFDVIYLQGESRSHSLVRVHQNSPSFFSSLSSPSSLLLFSPFPLFLFSSSPFNPLFFSHLFLLRVVACFASPLLPPSLPHVLSSLLFQPTGSTASPCTRTARFELIDSSRY